MALNMEVVAEGVESATQADFLRHQGCDIAQGHFFGHPLPADEATRLLASSSEGAQRPI